MGGHHALYCSTLSSDISVLHFEIMIHLQYKMEIFLIEVYFASRLLLIYCIVELHITYTCIETNGVFF